MRLKNWWRIVVAVGLGWAGWTPAAWAYCHNNVTDPICEDCEGNETECEGVNPFHVYYANATRAVTDLTVNGAVGGHALTWTRHAFSRFNGTATEFGQSHNWRHNYQWVLSGVGAATMELRYPNGNARDFSVVATNEWRAHAAAGDRIFGGANDFMLHTPQGWRYHFVKSAGSVYTPDYFLDAQGNQYTLTYDSAKRLVRVTEPGGRYLTVEWTQLPVTRVTSTLLANLTSEPAANQWTVWPVTNTNTFRYVVYQSSEFNYGRIAEFEAQGTNGLALAGTVWGALPAGAPDRLPAAAADGDPQTYYEHALPHSGFVGYEFAGPQRIGALRFYRGNFAMKNGQFHGFNEKPATVWVIARVTASDGRRVTYQYTATPDPQLPVLYQLLTGADYDDGAPAAYTYAQTYAGARPVMVEARDPRHGGAGAWLRYEYSADSVVGLITKEKHPVTGAALVELVQVAADRTEVRHANGKTVTLEHPSASFGRTTRRTDGLGRVSAFSYTGNNTGFLRTRTDPLGRVTTFDRNVAGNVLTNTAPDGAKQIWTRDGLERVLSYTDELGRTTTHTRDGQGRVTRTDYPDGSFAEWTYNGFGQPLTHRRRGGTGVPPAVETFTYDARGLKTSQTDPLGNVTTFEYDAADRLAAITDARGHPTQYEYNARDQLTKLTHADGSFRALTYDEFGNKLTETDELGHSTEWEYDEFNRVTSLSDPLGRTTEYAYNLNGPGGCGCCAGQSHPTAIRDPLGRVTTMDYDLEWQLIRTTDPAGHATSWTYDTAGNRQTQTDANNHTYRWVYDSRNRVIAETNAVGQATTFAYDAVGNWSRKNSTSCGATRGCCATAPTIPRWQRSGPRCASAC
jgi:YD repeat-containing protein